MTKAPAMTAVTPGREELLAKRDRLVHAATTMANDDVSKPGTMERHRLIERDEAIRDAAELLDRLAAKPASNPDAMNERRAEEDARLVANVREATIEECAKIAKFRFAGSNLSNIGGLVANSILALSTTEPKHNEERSP